MRRLALRGSGFRSQQAPTKLRKDWENGLAVVCLSRLFRFFNELQSSIQQRPLRTNFLLRCCFLCALEAIATEFFGSPSDHLCRYLCASSHFLRPSPSGWHLLGCQPYKGANLRFSLYFVP